MIRRHPEIQAALDDLVRHITGPCECGEDCDYVLAECCDAPRRRCKTHEAGETDVTVCLHGEGCAV